MTPVYVIARPHCSFASLRGHEVAVVIVAPSARNDEIASLRSQ